jgi:hypothetical protein
MVHVAAAVNPNDLFHKYEKHESAFHLQGSVWCHM